MGYREREAARNHRLKAGRNSGGAKAKTSDANALIFRRNATIELTSVERASRHGRPNRFWVTPGHVLISIERTVEENERYAIVEGDPHAALYVVPSER